MSRDIVDLLAHIRLGFKRAQMEPPEAIILKSSKEGMRLLREIADMPSMMSFRAGTMGKPVEHPDGSVYMEIEVVGMKVRWPATKYAQPNGGYVWQ